MMTICTPCAIVVDIRAWNNLNTEKKQRTQGTQREEKRNRCDVGYIIINLKKSVRGRTNNDTPPNPNSNPTYLGGTL